MHTPKVASTLYDALLPKKFLIIRDEIPGLKALRPDMIMKSDGFEEPLSLNADIGVS
jgi:hypothetical protein